MKWYEVTLDKIPEFYKASELAFEFVKNANLRKEDTREILEMLIFLTICESNIRGQVNSIESITTEEETEAAVKSVCERAFKEYLELRRNSQKKKQFTVLNRKEEEDKV